MTIIEPTAWKKFHGLRGGEKEASRQRALQLFPAAHALLARMVALKLLSSHSRGPPHEHRQDLRGLHRPATKLSQNDAFIVLGERNTPAAVKTRMRAVETRREKAKAKALQERDDLFHLWQKWRRERLDTLLAGPYGTEIQALLEFLRTTSLDDSLRLVDFIRAGNWHLADADTRCEILGLINAAITTLRERAGLKPFDNGIPPDEEPSTFLVIKEMFR
jgi:hypothetical protein